MIGRRWKFEGGGAEEDRGNQTAPRKRRSGIYFIQHIDEGLSFVRTEVTDCLDFVLVGEDFLE